MTSINEMSLVFKRLIIPLMSVSMWQAVSFIYEYGDGGV